MTAKIELKDGQGISNSTIVGVSSTGELIITGEGTLTNISSFQSLTTTGAFTFFGPIAGQQFIITAIALDSPANNTITIYEASSSNTTTVDKTLYQVAFGAAAGQIAIPLPFGGFIAVNEGEYVNAKATATTVNLNIIGYYHPKLFNPK